MLRLGYDAGAEMAHKRPAWPSSRLRLRHTLVLSVGHEETARQGTLSDRSTEAAHAGSDQGVGRGTARVFR